MVSSSSPAGFSAAKEPSVVSGSRPSARPSVEIAELGTFCARLGRAVITASVFSVGLVSGLGGTKSRTALAAADTFSAAPDEQAQLPAWNEGSKRAHKLCPRTPAPRRPERISKVVAAYGLDSPRAHPTPTLRGLTAA